MKKLSIGFHPYTKRKHPITKKTQIIMRVIIDGIKKEVRLDSIYDLTEKDLLKWNPFLQRVETKDSDINDYLNAIISRRKLIDLEILSKNTNFNQKQIIDKLLGLNEIKKEVTIYEYCKRYLREEIENSFKKEGTKKNYRNAIRQFCIFLELKGWTNLTFPEFKYENAHLFKKFMETSVEQMDILGIDKSKCLRLYTLNDYTKSQIKQQNSVVSSSTKIKNIKPVFEKAIDEDLIIKNPFNKIKLDFEGENEAPSLSISMLSSIYNYNYLDDGISYTKDLFLFMCFTGFSYVDTINFNNKEFEYVDGNIHLLDTKRRKKTGCQIKQILCDEAKNIVLKYYQTGLSQSYSEVFPYESLESTNRKLKIIQATANIPFELSTKNARITFKNLIRESNIKNPFLTKKFMGWRKSKTIEDIYDRFTVNEYLDAKSCIDNYLSKSLKSKNDCNYLILSGNSFK